MQARVSDPPSSSNPSSSIILQLNAPTVAAAPPMEAVAAAPLSILPSPSPQLPTSLHRRSISELTFRVPCDLRGFDSVAAMGVDEIGSEDDVFCTFLDIEAIGRKLELCRSGSEVKDFVDRTRESSGCVEETKIGDADGAVGCRPKHRHSCSADELLMMSEAAMKRGGVFGEVMEVKKAMTQEQLAELAIVDPKRAKRILANRQSAARSKERKARYISDLENKVQTLKTEATTLTAQLTLLERDVRGLSAENQELKLRVQAMEQQAQLRDALNEALKQEAQRLKIATGDVSNPDETCGIGQQTLFCTQSYFAFNKQQPIHYHQAIQLQPQFQQPQFGTSNHQMIGTLPNSFPDTLQINSPGRLQGLDINQGSHFVKLEGPSECISESYSNF